MNYNFSFDFSRSNLKLRVSMIGTRTQCSWMGLCMGHLYFIMLKTMVKWKKKSKLQIRKKNCSKKFTNGPEIPLMIISSGSNWNCTSYHGCPRKYNFLPKKSKFFVKKVSLQPTQYPLEFLYVLNVYATLSSICYLDQINQNT